MLNSLILEDLRRYGQSGFVSTDADIENFKLAFRFAPPPFYPGFCHPSGSGYLEAWFMLNRH